MATIEIGWRLFTALVILAIGINLRINVVSRHEDEFDGESEDEQQ